MTEDQKKIGVIKGLELFNPHGNNQDFLNYLGKFTLEVGDYFIPYFGKLNLIKYYKTRSGKYEIHLHEVQKFNKEQLSIIIDEIKKGIILLP